METTNVEHTPTPWKWERDSNGNVCECATLGDTLITLQSDYENDKADCDFVEMAVNAHAPLVAALERAAQLIREALPRFNWGASALDANAIALLNEVPGEIHAALIAARTPATER